MKAGEYDETLMRITARYVDEYEAGLQPRLDDYIRRYPHYANEIADFVAYYQSVEAPAKSQTTSPVFSYDSERNMEGTTLRQRRIQRAAEADEPYRP